MLSSLSRLQLLLVILTLILLSSAALGSDMEKTLASDLGLRGRVKECVERTTYSVGEADERTFSSTSTYSPDGHLLQKRTEQGAGHDYLTTYTYDNGGHLLKRSSGVEGSEQYSTTYVYDDKGRIASIVSGTGTPSVTYDYDPDRGQRRRIEHFPVIEARPNVAISSAPWEDGELSFAPPSGGTITTFYDEHDRPVEARINDAAGQLTMRIVRNYDDHGRVLGDRLIPEDLQSGVPAELSAQLNDAQKKTLARFMARAFASGQSANKYDANGRLIEKHITGGVLGDEVTNIRYNDHGDVTDEETARTPTPEMSTEYGMDDNGNMVPVSKSNGPRPSRSEIHYAYQYDIQGNWTEKTMSVRSEPGGVLKPSMTIRRTLTYY